MYPPGLLPAPAYCTHEVFAWPQLLLDDDLSLGVGVVRVRELWFQLPPLSPPPKPHTHTHMQLTLWVVQLIVPPPRTQRGEMEPVEIYTGCNCKFSMERDARGNHLRGK